jgi:two-component system chemotaxis response regulator CheY
MSVLQQARPSHYVDPLSPEARLARVHVLIADSNQKMRALVMDTLRVFGFRNLFGAEDGFEAMKLMRVHRIDLVITDWDLPLREDKGAAGALRPHSAYKEWGIHVPESGAAYVRCVRSALRSPNPYVPVIMLTGPTLRNHLVYARDAGVNEMLLKPLNVRDLCDRIAAVIEKPRLFITSEGYRGPCRRRYKASLPAGLLAERRTRDIRIIRNR